MKPKPFSALNHFTVPCAISGVTLSVGSTRPEHVAPTVDANSSPLSGALVFDLRECLMLQPTAKLARSRASRASRTGPFTKRAAPTPDPRRTPSGPALRPDAEC